MQTERNNYGEIVEYGERGTERIGQEESSELENLLKKNRVLLGIGAILVVLLLILTGKYIYDDYQARQVYHDYMQSYLDGYKIMTSVALAYFECSTLDEKNNLLESYREIMYDTLEMGELPKEKLKKYNVSLRRLLGSEAEIFIVDGRWNIDSEGLVDGMTYFGYAYSIDVAHDYGFISDEQYAEFERKDKEFFQNPSHDKAMEMFPYMLKLLENSSGFEGFEGVLDL